MHQDPTCPPTPRADAVRLLVRLETDNAYIDRLLAAEAKKHGAPQPLVQRLVRGVGEWQSKLDAILSQHLSRPLADMHAPIRAVLRLGAYELLFLTALPVPIVVSLWVEVAKGVGHRGTVGLVNAVLRRVGESRGEASVPNEALTPEELAAATNHPEWLVKRWVDHFGANAVRELCLANNTPQPMNLRVNLGRASVESVRSELEELGAKVSPGLFLPKCLRLEQLPRKVKLFETEGFQHGNFTVQDESAMVLAHFIAPQPGATIVDLCAAPGGKTTHLAELIENKGRILACDRAEHRAQLVTENCARLGATCVEVRVADALDTTESADIVLLDAPCSGTGVLQRKSDARWKKDEGVLEELVQLQSSLLQHAATLVRPGGLLVYGTCSLEPEENEEMVLDFLRRASDYRVERPTESFPESLLTQDGFYQSLPQVTRMAGAFGARLRRD